MSATTGSNSRILAMYRERTPRSMSLASEAKNRFPGGIVHDARRLDPYPLYVNRAIGSRKWDVDGNEYVDYYGGHGALLLGHAHPRITEAVTRQLALGTHYAACHELELQWAELVQTLVPCAELVRFTSSGTEANLLAVRLARAFTGRNKLVRFISHFHGWQDHTTSGFDGHFDGSPTPGVLAGVSAQTLLAPPDDIPGAMGLIRDDDDIAAVIIEPTGGLFGVTPLDPRLTIPLHLRAFGQRRLVGARLRRPVAAAPERRRPAPARLPARPRLGVARTWESRGCP